jgi:hypothetical protein
VVDFGDQRKGRLQRPKAHIAVDRRAPRLGNVPRRWICQVRIAPMSEQRLQIPGIGALGKL